MKLAIICATLFAAAVQARDFVLMDGASSRTRVYLFSQEEGQAAPQLIKEVNTQRSGGQEGLHVALTDDHDKNVKYFKELLKPLAASDNNDSPYDLYIYGSGAIRRKDEKAQAHIWTQVRSAIHDVAPNKFVVRAAETIPAKDESALMFKMLAGKPKTGLVEIGGEYLQAGLYSDNESFDNVGSVGASGAIAKNLLDSQNWSEKYNEVVDKLKEEKKESGDLLMEVQGHGRLAEFAQKIVHPCLMKAKKPLDMIEAKSIRKNPEHMYSEVIPFVGNTFMDSGAYDACFAAIATHIDKAVVGKHVPSIPTDFSLVGLGTLYFNQLNLKNLDITTKTVGDVVAAAKTVCAYDFSDMYLRVKDESLKISSHGLAELCWVSTHAATVLKHLLKLDDSQPFEQLTDKGWVLGMAQLIASNAASQEDFKYQPAIKA